MAFKNPPRSITWPPGARTNEARIVVGADLPDEMQDDIVAAVLFYVVDPVSNLEQGYFFIANSNTNVEFNQPSLIYGQVQYPTPGDPSSATSADVKGNKFSIMHDNLVPLDRFFNIHISDIGGFFLQDGARFGSIDSTFGTSDVDVFEITQDLVGGIARLSPDAFFSAPATSRGIFLAAVMTVLSGGVINVDSGGSITGDAGSTLDWNGSATFNDVTTDSVTAAGDTLTGSQNGVNDAATTSGNNDTTSATYVDLAGTGSVTSFSFTKRYAATRIKITMMCSGFAVTSTSGVEIGVRINGVDYKVAHGSYVLNERQPVMGVEYISGVAAGTYTVQGRWLRQSGTGTLRRDTNDWLTIVAEEVD